MPQELPNVANDNLSAPNSGDNTSPGNPTLPPGALSQVANTSISKSNSDLTHVCDISGNLQYAIAWASLQVKELIEAVRNAVASLWASSSSSPFADEVRTVIKSIQAQVKQIQALINKAQEVQTVITQYIQKLEQLIAYIISLPARIAKQLAGCLASAQNSLISTISNAATITTGGSSSALTAVLTQVKQLSSAAASSSSGPKFQKP